MSTQEDFAAEHGADYREDSGWGHVEGGILVHCGPYCQWRDSYPHGKFTRWVIQSGWEAVTD